MISLAGDRTLTIVGLNSYKRKKKIRNKKKKNIYILHSHAAFLVIVALTAVNCNCSNIARAGEASSNWVVVGMMFY